MPSLVDASCSPQVCCVDAGAYDGAVPCGLTDTCGCRESIHPTTYYYARDSRRSWNILEADFNFPSLEQGWRKGRVLHIGRCPQQLYFHVPVCINAQQTIMTVPRRVVVHLCVSYPGCSVAVCLCMLSGLLCNCWCSRRCLAKQGSA